MILSYQEKFLTALSPIYCDTHIIMYDPFSSAWINLLATEIIDALLNQLALSKEENIRRFFYLHARDISIWASKESW
jgi:hypothetical protein